MGEGLKSDNHEVKFWGNFGKKSEKVQENFTEKIIFLTFAKKRLIVNLCK
jgi:hypothetical protein